MSDPLRAAIDATSPSAVQFAALIGVNDRTVRRWLADPAAIPPVALALCRILAAHPTLARLLR